ncbi:hypothetical protein SAMN05216315_12050 [Nitrosospira sp. Nsp18]|nr:hypothetical protein SAMN05216315_12050 [Nitrosospira sp. Nsp18]
MLLIPRPIKDRQAPPEKLVPLKAFEVAAAPRTKNHTSRFPDPPGAAWFSWSNSELTLSACESKDCFLLPIDFFNENFRFYLKKNLKMARARPKAASEGAYVVAPGVPVGNPCGKAVGGDLSVHQIIHRVVHGQIDNEIALPFNR